MSNAIRSIQRKAKTELKITLGDLINSKQGLVSLCSQTLPAKTAFLLSKTFRAANAEFESYDGTLKKLCDRLGTPQETEGSFKIPKENQAEFQKEMNQLMATEVTLPNPGITLDSLSDAKLSALDLAALDWLVTE